VKRRNLKWFEPWQAKGYRLVHSSRGGHHKVMYGNAYVATISASPSNSRAPEHETSRILRRHEQTRVTKLTKETYDA
jgi:hypothetical protein